MFLDIRLRRPCKVVHVCVLKDEASRDRIIAVIQREIIVCHYRGIDPYGEKIMQC